MCAASFLVPATATGDVPRPRRVAEGGSGRACEADGEQRHQATLDEFQRPHRRLRQSEGEE